MHFDKNPTNGYARQQNKMGHNFHKVRVWESFSWMGKPPIFEKFKLLDGQAKTHGIGA